MKQKLLSLLVALIATTALWAYDCIVDGIYYNLNDTEMTAEVTRGGSNHSGSVTIPSSITYISKTYSVTTIGDYAFSGCSGLTSITIPNSVTTIGNVAFYGCSGLTSVTIPNSVTTIEYEAFRDCSGLTSITIPNSVTTIEYEAFYGCSNIKSVTWNAKNCNGYNFGSQVETFIFGDEVEVIPSSICRGMNKLTTITIGNSVTTIGSYAFEGCTSLPIIDNLRYADTYLVEAVDKTLSTYTVKEGTKWIGSFAFEDCSDLTSVTIGYSVTTIGESAFEGCSGLTSITIPNSVTTIGGSTFKGCSGLTSITIPNSVTTIENYAFEGCSGLTSITIPHSVTTIGKAAFRDCDGLNSVTWNAKNCNGYNFGNQIETFILGEDVEVIPSSLCSGMSKLTSITIPNSVTTIRYEAFYGCSGLTSVTIGNSVTTIGESAFEGCSGLTSITIPNSVTEIGEWAFYDCSGLTSITIPNSVTTIGDVAFYKCSGLSYIDFGCGLKEIGDCAFAGCNIDTAVIYSATPPACTPNGMLKGTFNSLSRYAYLFVPQDCERAYKLADGWEEFDIHVMEANVVPSVVDVTVTPSDNAVQVTWPISDNAVNYAIVITKGGEEICTLNFNAQGQLVNIAFKAPAADGSSQAPAATLTAQGYQFTVTGLNPGTAYNYSVVAIDAGGKTIAEHKGNFSTTGGTGLESVHDARCTMHKVFRNGQLLIETNNATYTPMGQKVK